MKVPGIIIKSVCSRLVLLAASSVQGGEVADDQVVPTIDPVFIVSAAPQYYSDIDLSCRAPRWLYEKQFSEGFTVSGAATVFEVRNEPVGVPVGMKPLLVSLAKNSKDAQTGAEDSPAVDPIGFFIVLGKDRKPNLFLSLQHGNLVTAHCVKCVDTEGVFQPDGQWVTFNFSPELAKYLKSVKDPRVRPESPFKVWLGAKETGTSSNNETGEHAPGGGGEQTR